jgi:enoyl-CoA hydratase/carnithine racemase
MDNLIISEENQGVLTITLNRVSKKNALNATMYHQLSELFLQANTAKNIHCVLIHGDNTCFTAGNDLQDFIENAEELAALHFVKILASFTKPIVAAVAGPAVGIGTTLLLHCDMIIAADNSKFKMPFSQLGLCPEAGSSLILPLKVGHAVAFELLVLGKMFNAEQALQYGIINQICSADEVLSIAETVANKIATLPNDAVMTTRRLLKASTAAVLPQVIADEGEEFTRLVKTDECKNILAQFFK